MYSVRDQKISCLSPAVPELCKRGYYKNKYSSTTVRVREVGGSNPPPPTDEKGTSSREEVPFSSSIETLWMVLKMERTVLTHDAFVVGRSNFEYLSL